MVYPVCKTKNLFDNKLLATQRYLISQNTQKLDDRSIS